MGYSSAFLVSLIILAFSHEANATNHHDIDDTFSSNSIELDESGRSYKSGGHSEPLLGSMSMFDISTNYIRGQLWNEPAVNGSSHRQGRLVVDIAVPSKNSPFTAQSGGIQCSSTRPCIDDSCCNEEGKCGFKEGHCSSKYPRCISNCDAKAPCGIDSRDGRTKCGFGLCCSFYGWCGFESVHCKDPEPRFAKTPCQVGFGSCEMKEPPKCPISQKTASKRRVAYYQGWNMRDRMCDKVKPSQINTKGLTHLIYAFIFFNPKTFEIEPMHPEDVHTYADFTKLQNKDLKTWVAVGGWTFNDPGIYQSAFSNMVSGKSSRTTFIKSLMNFMEKHGFSGADLDWEYPGYVQDQERKPRLNRGGRKEDTDNLVLLIKEMRAAFDAHPQKFGLSIVLAPDITYLMNFKPAAMQSYVDFMGFMSYDLAGPWDKDVRGLGNRIRSHTDITIIDRNFMPLWTDGVDPAKINMGLAYYGRSYKLSNPICRSLYCGFTGDGGEQGKCTAFRGVLSNREIQQLITDNAYDVKLNKTAMVKYMAYGANLDSFIAFDDRQTFELKENYANSRCLGGMMIWSIDFDPYLGGQFTHGDLTWIHPSIWREARPEVACEYPCTLVLPPYPVPSLIIDYPRVTVSNQGGFTTTLSPTPIIITQLYISTIIIDLHSTESTTTTILPMVIPTLRSWPELTWYDDRGVRRTTRPPGPGPVLWKLPTPLPPQSSGNPPRPPPGEDPSPPVGESDSGSPDPNRPKPQPPPFPPPPDFPTIHIVRGKPRPIVKPWPHPCCPGAGSTPESESDRDEEEEEEESCKFENSINPLTFGSIGKPPTAVNPNSLQPPLTNSQVPSTSNIPPTGVDIDLAADTMQEAFCTQFDAKIHMTTIPRKIFQRLVEENCSPSARREPVNGPRTVSTKKSINADWIPKWIEIKWEVTVNPGCEWKPSEDKCMRDFMYIIEQCGMQDPDNWLDSVGGEAINNCVTLKLSSRVKEDLPEPLPKGNICANQRSKCWFVQYKGTSGEHIDGGATSNSGGLE